MTTGGYSYGKNAFRSLCFRLGPRRSFAAVPSVHLVEERHSTMSYIVDVGHWWSHVYKLLRLYNLRSFEIFIVIFVSRGKHDVAFAFQAELTEIVEFKSKLLALNVAAHRFVMENKDYDASSLKADVSDLYVIWHECHFGWVFCCTWINHHVDDTCQTDHVVYVGAAVVK